MGAQGTTLVDFGAFPGASDASVAVAGQAAILAGSLAEAWLFPADTPDHLADEHLVEPISVFVTAVGAGVGFTIRAVYRGVGDTLAWGRWNVGWVWN